MFNYKEKEFDLPNLKGISDRQTEIHLGLYGGYVKHVNLLREKIHEFENADSEKNAYAISEMRRRFSFEFNGMRMHEYYFEQWETEPKEVNADSPLSQSLKEKYGSFEDAIVHFKTVGSGTRGIGWTILSFDNCAKTPHIAWVGDHELGQLAGLPILLAMDMWEHAYMVDYAPSEKKQYIESFFENLNWSVAEKRLKHLTE